MRIRSKPVGLEYMIKLVREDWGDGEISYGGAGCDGGEVYF